MKLQKNKIFSLKKDKKSVLLVKLFFSLSLLFSAGLVTAQNNFTLKMSVKAEGLPPEYAAYAEQDITIYIKGDKLKTERNGMMGSSVSLYDGKKMTSLIDNMGTKFGYTATKEELEAGNKDDKTSKPKIEYSSEKKMIAGYECSKAIVTSMDKDKKEIKTILWVTDKIKYDHPEANKAAGKGMMDLTDLKGYPLGMEMGQNTQGMDINIIMTTTEVLTTPVDDAAFVISTEGYTMMTYAEMLDKQKTMMGGGR
jgi:hypothetical protein